MRIHLEDPENAEKMMFFNDVDRDHGRTGTREATVRHDVDSLRDLHNRSGPPAVGKVTATRGTRGERSTETRHFLPVERLGPERFLKTVRLHRAAGNSLHRVLDVTMDGDRQRNRTAGGPDSLALMRRPATDVARIAPGKDAMRGKPGRRAGATTPWSGWSAPLSDLGRRRRNPKAIALLSRARRKAR